MHGEPVRMVDADTVEVGQRIVIGGNRTGTVTEIHPGSDRGWLTWRVVVDQFIDRSPRDRQMIVDEPPRQVLTASLVSAVPSGRYEPAAGGTAPRSEL